MALKTRSGPASRADGRLRAIRHLLDEPTTCLHPADTTHLLLLLQRLVNAGNTIIVIEHNLDMVEEGSYLTGLTQWR